MIDWEKRKKSEEWAKEKACEFCKKDSDLTFAEWCYQKGRADVESELLESKDSDELSQKIAIDILERGIEKGRKDGIREFAKWLTKSNYANGYFDTGNGFVSVEKVLAEYEKEQKNE